VESSSSLTAVDAVTAIVKLLSLLAVLQSCGLALFVALYRQDLSGTVPALARLTLVSALVAVGLVLASHWMMAARMSGTWSGLFDLALLKLSALSSGGLAAACRILGMGMLALAIARNVKWLALIGIMLALGSFALSGHSTTFSPRVVLAPLLMLHVLIAIYWLGALPALSMVARYERSVVAIEKFSKHATTLVPILAIAGAGMAFMFVPSWSGLASPYGAALMLKMNGFFVLLLVAAFNKLRLVPALRSGDASARALFRRTAMLEYALIAAVLAATSLLTTVLSPP
jgi:copper resistance protein D